MGELHQLQASSLVTSRVHQTYPAVTGVMGYKMKEVKNFVCCVALVSTIKNKSLECCSFNHEFYHQVGGVAMGSKMGPNYTCLFIGYVEEQISQQYTGTVPQLQKRHIDDVVGTACCSRVELEDYIAFVSNFHPALQFTHTISETELPFLDINLRVSGDHIRTSIHYKATDTHSYLHYNSSHPRHYKESLPYSQLLRLRRICTDQANFLDKAKEMASFFERHGYSTQTLKRDLEKMKPVSKRRPFQKQLHIGKE